MMIKASLLAVCTLALGATAMPFPQAGQPAICASKIEAIVPSTVSCANAQFPEECADSSRAAPAISRSFTKYGINSKGEQSALVALMLFESGNFTFNKNHFPGVPGQGTKNMQSPAFNLLYAQSVFDNHTVGYAQAQGPEAVLRLVSNDNESFGSAAWFLSSQCNQTVRDSLATGTKEGWTTFLTGCVGTTDTPERDAVWVATNAVL
ncbi:hypothetical protein BU24DRAFT_420975 [Aaosphaeria arxii CBS 175.79]|uniref:Uncharacterized protein n=1 Tax=Aaosphaeria arxii CBS 175.79 TaxID=1450172 RepID=A0A6A5XYA3_9PLEO|nr:uncharacterized protein BU24DRAFT_420975 [Aaosphaeria arxii CBS 175.79]KAF2017929.1 hypothetical protein BU24DRAFT_420975 [Aaosphaeria arxii CBS 175.79]